MLVATTHNDAVADALLEAVVGRGCQTWIQTLESEAVFEATLVN